MSTVSLIVLYMVCETSPVRHGLFFGITVADLQMIARGHVGSGCAVTSRTLNCFVGVTCIPIMATRAFIAF